MRKDKENLRPRSPRFISLLCIRVDTRIANRCFEWTKGTINSPRRYFSHFPFSYVQRIIIAKWRKMQGNRKISVHTEGERLVPNVNGKWNEILSYFFLFSFPFFFSFLEEFDAYARATLNVLEEKFSRYDSSTWCKRGQWNTVQVENLRRGRAVKTRRTITNHSGGCRWSGADYFQPFNSFHSVTFLSFPLCMRYMCILFSYSTFHTAKDFRLFACQFFLGDIRDRWEISGKKRAMENRFPEIAYVRSFFFLF